MTQGPNYADSDDISLDIGYRRALKMKHGGKDARKKKSVSSEKREKESKNEAA